MSNFEEIGCSNGSDKSTSSMNTSFDKHDFSTQKKEGMVKQLQAQLRDFKTSTYKKSEYPTDEEEEARKSEARKA